MSIEGLVLIAIYILSAIGVFIGRNWLKASIERGVQHEFDKKIEALRTEMRKGEEAFKSELRMKGNRDRRSSRRCPQRSCSTTGASRSASNAGGRACLVVDKRLDSFQNGFRIYGADQLQYRR